MRNRISAVVVLFLFPLIAFSQETSADAATQSTIAASLRKEFPDISPQYIQAVADTPREPFIPESFRSLAGTNLDIPVLQDAIIPSPGLTVKMLHESGVWPGTSVLIIGKACGYLGAAAALLTEKVTVVELSGELYRQYVSTYNELKISTVALVDTLAGAAETGFMFDVVIVHGATPVLPPEISSFLRPSGVLLLPITGESGYQNLLKIQYGNGLTVRSIGESFFPLVQELYQPD